MATMASVNGAVAMQAYQGNLMGKDADLQTMVEQLRKTFSAVGRNDLSDLEAMLVSQATALQTIFTSLARRASLQVQLRHYETFLGLALKAQSQSRATISALVDLRYPRQVAFVRQANIAQGAQQVNNASAVTGPAARAEEIEPTQNKLLEADHGKCSGGLDSAAPATTARSDPAEEAMASIHRPRQPRR